MKKSINILKKSKRKDSLKEQMTTKENSSNMEVTEDNCGDEDIFEAELLPSYAKTYILPRRMRRASVVIEEDEDSKPANRRRSVARKQSMVTPEFQMSMLRATLEEKKMFSPCSNDQDSDLEHASLSFGNFSKSR